VTGEQREHLATADAAGSDSPGRGAGPHRRQDGTLRRPKTIWVVPVADRVFIRSTNGRGAAWFRWALATGRGRIQAGGTGYDVVFSEVQQDDLPAVDDAYRSKYGRYASVVDHLLDDGPRAATLELLPS